MKWTREKCLESAIRYTTIAEWRRADRKAADAAYSNGWINYIKQYIQPAIEHNKFSDQDIIDNATKYNTRMEWRDSDRKFYQLAKSRRILDKCTKHMLPKKTAWTLKLCQKIAGEYKTLNEWSRKDNGSYQAAIRNGWINNINFSFKSKTKRKSIDEVIKLLPEDIKIVPSSYKRSGEVAEFVHAKYGSFTAKVYEVLSGQSTHPSVYANNSKAENELSDYVNSLCEIQKNVKFKEDNVSFELDIYIPNLKLGIEYNGLYWHSDLNKDRLYHYNKMLFFKKMGIQLLQFYEDEWRDKKDIIKSIIANKIKNNSSGIYARKCIIRQISNKNACDFLDVNHLMGSFKRCKYIGLYHNNVLVSVMGYKKYKDGIDISRFCNKLNTSVVGGLSKLLSYIEDNENPNFIQSFVDLRYGNGDSLKRLNFQHVGTTVGFHWTDKKYRYNRLYCKANMDGRMLSEKEYAREMKLYKIYDAGQAKFIKEL